MRRRCKHENASDKPGECTFDMVGNIVYEVEFRECLDCGEWLPVGPARDTEQTALELRAAELAHGIDNEADFTDCEWMGMGGDEVYVTIPPKEWHTIDDLSPRKRAEWETGYLAKCIVETETP